MPNFNFMPEISHCFCCHSIPNFAWVVFGTCQTYLALPMPTRLPIFVMYTIYNIAMHTAWTKMQIQQFYFIFFFSSQISWIACNKRTELNCIITDRNSIFVIFNCLSTDVHALGDENTCRQLIMNVFSFEFSSHSHGHFIRTDIFTVCAYTAYTSKLHDSMISIRFWIAFNQHFLVMSLSACQCHFFFMIEWLPMKQFTWIDFLSFLCAHRNCSFYCYYLSACVNVSFRMCACFFSWLKLYD